ncbi:hypothetical protein RHSIM_Rhsim12G0034800 [Rhododendron simsii]|uniref:Uncharacterized protein n=1 Tax=Rhododendron simsii TaxID=118357 RepID=A0A834G2H8_RHOSS|nr:hypothetical protein RHSIM_Rhsim12G0034800 [Rhododendron simsii]
MADTRMAFVSEEEKQIAGPELINSSGTKSNRRLDSSRSDGIDYDSFDYEDFPVKQWMQQFRKFTSLEKMDYQRRLRKSGVCFYRNSSRIALLGFDVGDIPNNIHPRDAHIIPVWLDDSPTADEKLKELKGYSKLALDKYNNHNSVCVCVWAFLAKDVACSEHSLPKNFQALVGAGKDEATVDFCRPEP